MRGLDVVRIVTDEGVSAARKLTTRPGGSEIAAEVAAGAKHVLALKLDRLFRDTEDALAQTREWDRQGVALHIVDMGGSALDTTSAMGRMFLTVTAAIAELERNLIGERTSTALKHKKTHLKAYSPTPFGYERMGADLVSNDAEQALIDQLKAWDTEGMPLRRIADRLNANGIPTKRGGKKWYASTVAAILDNTLHQ